MTTLYIGNLPYAVTTGELAAFLRGYGASTALILRDCHTGRSLGYGFAEVDSPEAILALDGTQLWGRQITVRLTGRPRPTREVVR